MPMSQPRWIDAGGVRTRYFEAGEGEPLVLLHGGVPGSDAAARCADDWAPNFDGLARRFRVFAVDRLGQGHTGNPAADEGYAMDAVVRHAGAALRALGVEGAHLVGHGSGGYVACRLTVESPELARTCAVVDSSSCAPGTGRDEIVLAGRPKPALSAESQRWVLERQAFDPACVADEWVDALVRVAELPKHRDAVAKMTGDGLLWTRFLPGLLADKEDMFRVLAQRGIQRPVLLVCGDSDPVASLDRAAGLHRVLAEKERRARWHVLPRAGHFSFREHPDRFNEVLAGFVRAP